MLAEINHANALVVGASQGIGLGFVRALLEKANFQRIFATYRSQSNAAELLTLQEEYGDRLQCLQIDITDESQIITGIKQIQESVKQLQLAIYCVQCH